MKKKHVRVEKLMIPLMTLAIAMGGFSNVQAMELLDGVDLDSSISLDKFSDESATALEKAGLVDTVEQTDVADKADEVVQLALNNASSGSLDLSGMPKAQKAVTTVVENKGNDTRATSKIAQNSDTPTYQRTDALKMRQQLEKLFNSYVSTDGGHGVLYTGHFMDSTGEGPTMNITYARAYIHSKEGKQELLAHKAELAKIAAENFKDITGNESWAYLVPSAVYYGLVPVVEVTQDQAAKSNGLYKAGDLVTGLNQNTRYADLAVMLGGWDGNHQGVNSNHKLAGAWYSKDIGTLNCDSGLRGNLDKTSVLKSINKGEMASNIAGYLLEGDVGKAKVGSYNQYYTDIKKVTSLTAQQINKMKLADMRTWYTKSIASGLTPSDFVTGMLALENNGISLKDSSGKSNWNKPVSRGYTLEVLFQVATLD